MNTENTKKIVEAFPNLYGHILDVDPSVSVKQAYRTVSGEQPRRLLQSFQVFGFECGDGWFQLLWDLSEKIQEEFSKMDSEAQKCVRVCQVKEKYGTLRFYIDGANELIDNTIEEYSVVSSKTCEECGKEGIHAAPFNWYCTLCEEHWVDYIQSRYTVSVEDILQKVRDFGKFLESDDA